jgi:HK97 family phage portal protein
MTWLSAIRRASVESPAVPLTSTTLIDWLSGPKVHAGVSVNEKNALGMPAVWRAVNLIAGTCASLPLHLYRYRDDDTRLKVRTALLDQPHPDLTPFEVWEQVFAHLALWGNAYLLKLRNQGGQLSELWPIHPSRVKTGRASDGTKIYQVDNNTDDPQTDDTILHIPGFGYDGIVGLSPITIARQGIGLAMAAEEYGARLFGSGSLASGILQTDRVLDQPTADRLKARWKERVGGLDRAHEVAVLDAGTKFQQLSIPPEDAQFIESRRFQISEVARMYGVPPHMLMDTEKSTSWGTGIEQQNIAFVVYTLRPWLTRVEQRVSSLYPRPQFVRFSVEGLLRGDTQQRAAFYKQMWDVGAFSTNDIRRYEDLSPVDGGDVRYRPLNMGILGEPDPDTDDLAATERGNADA